MYTERICIPANHSELLLKIRETMKRTIANLEHGEKILKNGHTDAKSTDDGRQRR